MRFLKKWENGGGSTCKCEDPLFKGVIRYNILAVRTDIIEPMGWERMGTSFTDVGANGNKRVWRLIKGL